MLNHEAVIERMQTEATDLRARLTESETQRKGSNCSGPFDFPVDGRQLNDPSGKERLCTDCRTPEEQPETCPYRDKQLGRPEVCGDFLPKNAPDDDEAVMSGFDAHAHFNGAAKEITDGSCDHLPVCRNCAGQWVTGAGGCTKCDKMSNFRLGPEDNRDVPDCHHVCPWERWSATHIVPENADPRWQNLIHARNVCISGKGRCGSVTHFSFTAIERSTRAR